MSYLQHPLVIAAREERRKAREAFTAVQYQYTAESRALLKAYEASQNAYDEACNRAAKLLRGEDSQTPDQRHKVEQEATKATFVALLHTRLDANEKTEADVLCDASRRFFILKDVATGLESHEFGSYEEAHSFLCDNLTEWKEANR